MSKPIIPLIIRGKVIETDLVEFPGRGGGIDFLSPDPAKYVDQLPMRSPGDLADLQALSTNDILDFLEELGRQLDIGSNVYMQEARLVSRQAAPTTPSIVDDEYDQLPGLFERTVMLEELGGDHACFDGWVNRKSASGRTIGIRAFGARCLHIVAGNSPVVSAMTVIRGALTRGDSIIKSPSNDPFTAAAVIRTMCAFAPDHPVTRHFSVCYWKGGDEAFERRLYQPANIEKIVAWGGFASIKHVTRYIQPGLELISLDPKRSCSIVGADAFASEALMREAAVRTACDIASLNQVACSNARTVFVQSGTDDEGVAKAAIFGRLVYDAMLELPERISTQPKSVDRELKANVESVRLQDDWYDVVGGRNDEGAVIVSKLPEPVEFATSLNNRVSNIIPVDTIDDIMQFVDSYTQTVGVYPEALKNDVKDILPLFGAQRIVSLGYACTPLFSGPQDAIEPVRRMAKWIVDEKSDGFEPLPWAKEQASAAKVSEPA